MKTQVYVTYIVFVLLLMNCGTSSKPDFPTAFAENNETFKRNSVKINSVIEDIKNHLKLWNNKKKLTIKVDSLSDQTKAKLKELGIDTTFIIILPTNNCHINYSILFNVDRGWNIETLRRVQLRYVPCSKYTQEGRHYHDGYHVDFWGQGGNWYIASDTDWL